MLIDTHAHLSDETYNGAKEIIDSMQSDNLQKIIAVSYDLESSLVSSVIAKTNKDIYFAAGTHPNNTKDIAAGTYAKYLELSKDEKCVAIGEIGLDYHYDDTDRLKQKRELLCQLELVREAGLPVIFHVRDAYEDMYDIIKQNADKIKNGGVMHCFSGSKETALQYIDMGFYISFSGSVTFKNAKKFPEIIAALPKDRVLVETDCPYLSPDPFRGQLNYPKYVKYTAQKIADIWRLPLEEVEDITTANALKLFAKIKV